MQADKLAEQLAADLRLYFSHSDYRLDAFIEIKPSVEKVTRGSFWRFCRLDKIVINLRVADGFSGDQERVRVKAEKYVFHLIKKLGRPAKTVLEVRNDS